MTKKIMDNQVGRNFVSCVIFWVVYMLLSFVLDRRLEWGRATAIAVGYFLVMYFLGRISPKLKKMLGYSVEDEVQAEENDQ